MFLRVITSAIIIIITVTSAIAQKKSNAAEKSYTSTEIVISGNMKKMSKKDSPLPIEVYRAEFFQKAAVNNLLDATQQITGLRPQVNCSVCNTGDIHLNGMEGPYTAVLIDGMPIISSLSTVYGLSGIPLSMIDRVEVIKGPGSAMYGSEAMAGIINIITKDPHRADKLYIESSMSSQSEFSNEFAYKWKMSKNTHALLSLSLFNFNKKLDMNNDLFTDIPIQNRISLFNKYLFENDQSEFNIAYRLLRENRWGGQLNWTEEFRSGDSVYGETIQTNRAELISSWKPNKKIPLEIQLSYVFHQQNSTYGTVDFNAYQHTFFTQAIYRITKNKHFISTGIALRNNVYDDNTILTRKLNDTLKTAIRNDIIPGIFVQDEIKFNNSWKLLLALRSDYNENQGMVLSPRTSLQHKANELTQYRLGAGRGFRIVNVFTEDHAALTGDRKIEFQENLNPESSINSFFAIDHIFFLKNSYIKSEFNLFYTYFFNRIIANYDLDPNKVIYKNLDGHSITRGLNAKFDWQTTDQLNLQFGFTVLDAYERTDTSKIPIIFSSHFSGNMSISYRYIKYNFTIDYSNVFYSPMRLPVLVNDFRPEYSDWYAIHTIQGTKKWNSKWETYIAVKNIFNFLPRDPIMRSFDPFDKQVNINNPNNYTFDATYGYAVMQGRRLVFGIRYVIAGR